MSDGVLSEIDDLLEEAARAARFEPPLPEAPSAPETSGPGAVVDPAVLLLASELGVALAHALPPVIARAQAARAAAEPAAAPSTAAKVTVLYARYLGLFVGAGLMAGAVVHFPLAPFRYAVMGLVGALVFAAGSVGDGFSGRTGRGRAVSLGASLALALGVGMVAGGIQHFEDVPGRATVLIPAGLLVGLVAFVLRDGHRMSSEHAGRLAAGAVLLAMAAYLGLGTMVPRPGAGGAAGGHAHGAAEAAHATSADPHAAAPASAPPQQPALPATTKQAPAAPDDASPESGAAPVSRYASPAAGNDGR
jgi:hypothetical protein